MGNNNTKNKIDLKTHYRKDEGLTVDMEAEDVREIIMFRSLHCMRTIKNCCLFFVSLTLIGILGYIFILLVSSAMPK